MSKSLIHGQNCPITLVPVNPAKHSRIGRMGSAVGDAVGPVLRQPVLLGDRPEARPHHRHLHHDVRLVRADVVPP